MEEKWMIKIRKGSRVSFDFDGHGEEIEESFNFNKPLKSRLRPGKIHIVQDVLPDGNIILSDTGLLSFAPKFLIILCKEEDCLGQMFCIDGLCRSCFLKEVAIASCGELV
ncbi:MAG: hypothetical protein V3574_00950 [Candidatus Moraniibacteriota bacterium]